MLPRLTFVALSDCRCMVASASCVREAGSGFSLYATTRLGVRVADDVAGVVGDRTLVLMALAAFSAFVASPVPSHGFSCGGIHCCALSHSRLGCSSRCPRACSRALRTLVSWRL